jgi:hypothetical protein
MYYFWGMKAVFTCSTVDIIIRDRPLFIQGLGHGGKPIIKELLTTLAPAKRLQASVRKYLTYNGTKIVQRHIYVSTKK